jgi:hypothetical protein
MRSFSALLGVLLVLVVERIGRLLAPSSTRGWLPLLAALVAAVNPLLIYYGQEARMYMLLALAGAGLFWAMLGGSLWDFHEVGTSRKLVPPGGPAWGYVLFAVVGLWTHYSFAVVLAAANLAWLARWLVLYLQPCPERSSLATWRILAAWTSLNLAALLLFLPWLPTAIVSVASWPKGGLTVSWLAGVEDTLRTLLFGPLRATPHPLWLWLAIGALLPLLGAARLFVAHGRTSPTPWWALSEVLPLVLWFGLPIGLMAGLGLFTDAFLKILIAASPPWCLLVACVPLLTQQRIAQYALATAVAVFAIAMAALVLPPYYEDTQARDNYQGIAAYLSTASDPQRDLVILDAPGQQEVWHYYDPGLPVLALPATRPAAAADVESTLASATAGRRNLYALFWATDEADPERLVETWLDSHAFKALDVWQGNLRLAIYTLERDLKPLALAPVQLGGAISLAGQAQPENPQRVAAGDAAAVQLRWDVLQDVDRRYKVSVQLLDSASQIIAQRDGEPVGGSRPTDTWRTGDQILDNYALPVPFGTPPGEYRLVAAMYDAQTGQRLTHLGGDTVELGSIWVERPQAAVPAGLIPMVHRLEQRLGSVNLLGYDAYRKDFAHAPQMPLQSGDIAHLVLYWQAPDPLPEDWPEDLVVTLRLGSQVITAPLAGAGYPTAAWQAGEVVRGQFDIPYDGTDRRPQVEVAGRSVSLDALPVE